MTNDAAKCDSAAQYYATRQLEHMQGSEKVAEAKGWVSRSRLSILAIWLVLLVLFLNGYLSSDVAWGTAGIAFLGFLFLAAWDERLADRLKLSHELAEISRIQLARLHRRWKEIPEVEIELPDDATNVSYDLDVFGHASLFQLTCRAHTARGMEFLRDWFLVGATTDVIRQRNEAATKLASMKEFREQLDLQGRVLQASAAGPRSFIEWAESERWLENRRWLTWVSRLSVVTWVGTIVLASFSIVPEMPAVGICVVVGLLNLLLSVFLSGNVHDIFEKVDSRQHDVQHYSQLLQLTEQLPNAPELISRLRGRLGSQASRPRLALTRLSRIMKVAQMRHSSAAGLIHLLLQLLFLIDFHVLGALENWHRQFGAEVRTWFDTVGELEAIASLASLVHDHPTWTFPSVDNANDRLNADTIGHPLLADPVCNSVQLGPAGTFLLVTGSNMSGKSTLLRTVGLNTVLAQAGAPVHAKSLSLPHVELATSMRIQDSLEDGISFFMAELQRLKDVVDQAERLQSSDTTLLFLLDEILQGTNSAERHIAVAQVVRRLTGCGALGAISTHDLELAAHPDLTSVCKTVHFKESFDEDGQMTFDYQMQDGVATTSNALKLLELVGIRS